MADVNILEIENKRIEALTSYDIKYSIEEPELNDLIRLASIVSGRPLILLSLVDENTAWIKSRIGTNLISIERSMALCNLTIYEKSIIEICDTTLDQRSKSFKVVIENGIRYYTGVPLRSPDGYNIGGICVCDYEPGVMNQNQKAGLAIIADQIIRIFEFNKKSKQLELANERNKCITKAKEEFLNNISHELRTPLNAIYGFAQLLSKSQLNNEQRENVSIIKSSVENLIKIINDILDFSKIEYGKVKIEEYKFNIREVISQVYNLLSNKAREKGLTMNFRSESNIPTMILGDKVRLNQILINLIGNAIKYTDKGCVELNVSLISQVEGNVELLFSVKDTGIGIPEDKIDKLFERFEQLQVNNCKRFGGTGLGLCITKSLIELQDGSLKVKSEEGKGSEFYFNIKYKKAEEHFSPIKTEEFKTCILPFDKCKVIVIDDIPLNVKLIKKILEGWNMIVETAEDGRQAIEKIKDCKYDLILMDLQMPNMNGLEASSIIRKKYKLNTPIIAMTANDNAIEKRKCIELGIDEYITKPFKEEELYSKVAKMIKVKSKEKIFRFPTFNSVILELGQKNKYDFLHSHRDKTKKALKVKLPSIVRFEKIDLNKLKEYSDGDKEMEKDIITNFIQDIPCLMKQLEESICKNDMENIKKLAHKMKSFVSYFGLNKVLNNLIEIQKVNASQDISTIRTIYCNVKNNIVENLKELRQLIDKYI